MEGGAEIVRGGAKATEGGNNGVGLKHRWVGLKPRLEKTAMPNSTLARSRLEKDRTS